MTDGPNSQCQLTISGGQIYNYCRKDKFCDARLFSDGRGCNTKANLCAIDESCNAATNKCVRVYPDAGAGEAYDSNQHRLKLKKAIENALTMLKTRLNGIEARHQNQAAGAVAGGFPDGGGGEGYNVPRYPDAGAGEAYSGPQTLSEWKTALTRLKTDTRPVSTRSSLSTVAAASRYDGSTTLVLTSSMSSAIPTLSRLPAPLSFT